MQILLTPAESEEIFHNALCDGLQMMGGYGLKLKYDKGEYAKAKEELQAQRDSDDVVCYEDVLSHILRRGNTLTMIDTESGEEPRTINAKDVHERVQMVDAQHILDMINEEYDADTADCVLQTVFFGEVIFG